MSLKFLTILILLLAFAVPSAWAEERVRRNVEIEWDAIDGATLYEIQVTSKEDSKKKPMRFKLHEPKWSANIKPGKYSMQVRSYDDRSVPGDWGPASDLDVKLPAIIAVAPAAATVIAAKHDASEDVTLKWEPIPGAEKFRVSAHSTTTDWKQESDFTTNSATLSVPVGQAYEWNVTAIDEKGQDGEVSSENYKFDVKGPALEKPKLDKPMSKFVREVTWNQPSYAKNYSYELKYQNPKTKKWETVESKDGITDSKVVMDNSRPSGKYRIAVQAHGDRRDDSPRVQMDFQMRGGFRDPAALDTAILRDSIVKPSNYYAIASYLLTKVSYAAESQELNSKSSFDAIGGTGRIGVGYQDPESNWGGFGIVDYSGFIIQGQNFKFASMELHLTRKIELGQKGILLFATGLFSKELPIVRGTYADGFDSVGKVRDIGPHAGFVYWIPLSDRFGLQANARVYYTLTGSASGGEKALSSMSYQYGLLGSYRLDKNWMGYAGYAFRHDEAIYNAVSESSDPGSFAHDGDKDSISIDGHYINLILEFSF